MQILSNPTQIKLLGHSQRQAITQYLMKRSATLSQLAFKFTQSAAHIRHHVKVLEEAGLIGMVDPPAEHNHLEKYYRATSEAWLIQWAILPESDGGSLELVLASKDAATHGLAKDFGIKRAGVAIQVLPLNSLDGLITLRQGICHMATCHLKDPDSGQYNRSFVRHLFPGQEMVVWQLYQREEGLIVQPGNPLAIRNLADLTRPELRFINRERGSGIRIWLDQALKDQGISPNQIEGYESETSSHANVARVVQTGDAHTGLGIVAAARKLGLDFIPLFSEPYELVIPAELIADSRYAPFFEHLNSGEFRAAVQSLDGYLIPPSSGQMESVL